MVTNCQNCGFKDPVNGLIILPALHTTLCEICRELPMVVGDYEQVRALAWIGNLIRKDIKGMSL